MCLLEIQIHLHVCILKLFFFAFAEQLQYTKGTLFPWLIYWRGWFQLIQLNLRVAQNLNQMLIKKKMFFF